MTLRTDGPRPRATQVDPIPPDSTAGGPPGVKVWAALGAIVLVGTVYIWAKWIFGPEFRTVPSGPSEPPTWMKIAMDVWQPAGIIAVLVLFYYTLLRPWLRDRRVTYDGLLCLSLLFVSCQDPLSSYFQNWYAYNTYMVNFGSRETGFPGWMSFGEPGAIAAEPILFTIPAYIYYLFLLTVVGCRVMRRVRDRWPGSGVFGQVGACFVALTAGAVIVEGLIWFPLGILSYPGGVGPALFADTYHKFPLHEAVFISVICTASALVRLRVNDHGETLGERGVHQLRLGAGRSAGLRFLAAFGVMSALFFFLYNVPTAIIVSHSAPWPRDLQSRSYLTNYLCGEGTDRACPSDYTPLSRPGSAYIGPDGQLRAPDGATRPKPVPFQ
jgi:hypothetical protein